MLSARVFYTTVVQGQNLYNIRTTKVLKSKIYGNFLRENFQGNF